MKIEIKHRYTGTVLFEAEAASVMIAVQKAVEAGANLSGADLRAAYLSGADLSAADLRRADLRRADLSGADLRAAYLSGADLSAADLSGADLSGADLSGADLSGADLSGADLSAADLSGAYLRGADLRRADLRRANLRGAKNIDQAKGLGTIRSDLWVMLLNAPLEVPALLQALKDGKVDGSVYTGQCACLVGTIANARHCSISELPASLAPDAQRPAERWFMGIKPGDTPDKSVIAKMAIAWIEEFQAALSAAMGSSGSSGS